MEHLLENLVKADKSCRESSVIATPVRSPRKGAERIRPSSEKEKEQIGLISKVLDDVFDVVRDILRDGDDHESSDVIKSPMDPTIALESLPEQEQGQGQGREDETVGYAAGYSSTVDAQESQTVYPPPAPPPPPPSSASKRDSMVNLAVIAQSRALRAGSILKPSGRRRSGTRSASAYCGANVDSNADSSQVRDDITAPV